MHGLPTSEPPEEEGPAPRIPNAAGPSSRQSPDHEWGPRRPGEIPAGRLGRGGAFSASGEQQH
jgi:hypothetical protein